MHWSDGVTETYSNQGDGFLQVTDLRGGKTVIYAEPSAPSLLWAKAMFRDLFDEVVPVDYSLSLAGEHSVKPVSF